MVLWWRVFYLGSTGSTESVPPSIKDSSVLALLLCAPYQAPLHCMSALVIQVTPDLWTKVPVDPDQTFFPAILHIFTLSPTPTWSTVTPDLSPKNLKEFYTWNWLKKYSSSQHSQVHNKILSHQSWIHINTAVSKRRLTGYMCNVYCHCTNTGSRIFSKSIETTHELALLIYS